MQATFRSAEMLMHKGQTLELGDAARSVVTALCGAVWLTRDGELSDRILLPGQSVSVGRDSQVWLSAFEETRIRIEQPEAGTRSLRARARRSLLASYLRFMRAARRRFGALREASQAY